MALQRWVPPLGLALAGAGVAAGALAYAVFVEPRRIVVERVCIPVRDLPPELDGFTLVQLSDLHSGGDCYWSTRLRRAVGIVNDLRPDLIVLTGDVTDETALVPESAAILAGLRAPHGIVAVLGNHDYYGSPHRRDMLARALDDSGIVLLRNRVHSLASPAPLRVVGLDDAHTGHEKLAVALGYLPQPPQPRGVRILLSHYPDVVERLAPGTCDLVLSGHAHGGQLRLPVLNYLARRYHARTAYSQGLYSVDGTPLYVNRGLGVLFPQGRFLCPPEITHITLVLLRPRTSVA